MDENKTNFLFTRSSASVVGQRAPS